MTEPQVKFRKLTVYYVAFDEDDKDISSNIDWIVGQADQTDLRVADYEIEEWNNE